MKRFWSIALGILFVLALAFFIGGAFLDNHWRVEVSVIIAAGPEAIHPFVDAPRQYPRWMGWNDDVDPSLARTYDGPESGVGASISWRGNTMGSGQLIIRESSVQRGVVWEERIEASAVNARGELRYEVVGEDRTRVTWSDVGELPRPHGIYFRPMVEGALRRHFEIALAHLKAAAEGRPPPSVRSP